MPGKYSYEVLIKPGQLLPGIPGAPSSRAWTTGCLGAKTAPVFRYLKLFEPPPLPAADTFRCCFFPAPTQVFLINYLSQRLPGRNPVTSLPEDPSNLRSHCYYYYHHSSYPRGAEVGPHYRNWLRRRSRWRSAFPA